MKVLLTGAGGFIGKVIGKQLVDNGHHVVGLDVCPKIDGIDDWVQIGADQPLSSVTLPTDITGIIHLAQSPAYRLGPPGEEAVFNTNLALHAALLRYAADNGVTHFTSASTGSVYEPYTTAMRENELVRPTGYYGASKFAAEILSDAYRDRFKIANLRLFFVYGPGQKQMLIARLIDSIRNGEAVNLPSEGPGLTFVPTFVDDVAACFVKSIEQSWTGPINIASPQAVTFEELLNTIANAMGKDLNLERKGDSPKHPIVPNLEKLSTLVNLNEFHDLKGGILKAVQV